MISARLRHRTAREDASTLLIAMLTTATLSVVVGAFLLKLTERSQTAANSAAWQQAGFAAESAADLAIAEIRRVVPDLASLPGDAWSGWQLTPLSSSASPSLSVVKTVLEIGKSIPNTIHLTLEPLPLVHGGEGPSAETSVVTIDAPAKLVDLSKRQWLRVRATGTALAPGRRQASKNKLDNHLRMISFFRDVRTGDLVSRPQISRTIELIVRPVPLFNAAILSQGKVDISHKSALIDSFDSTDPLKSSAGEYDSKLRQQNGSVYTNGAEFDFRGTVYGNVGMNGGRLDKDAEVTGAVSDSFSQRLLPVREPVWPSASAGSGTVGDKEKVTIAASLLKVSQHKLSEVRGDLKVTGLPGSSVEIWVTGDMTGSLRVDPGVQATIYLAGDLKMKGDDLANESHRAGHLKIYGIQPPEGESRSIELNLKHDLYAAIYAPGHSMKVTGDADLMGSFTVLSLTANSKVKFHFDEALAKDKAPIGDFKVASWVEELP